MASENYHEPFELLSPPTREMHRGIRTLMEELEAIDWYQQRVDVCGDDELRAVLIHNKNEEIEHAMMTLEWLRRASPELDSNIRTYLLTQGPITQVEAVAEVAGNGTKPKASAAPPGGESAPPGRLTSVEKARLAAPAGAHGSLGIGSLRNG